MNTDSLGDRMKLYEDAYRLSFPPRLPVILRLDGRAFHSKPFNKPFDYRHIGKMCHVMRVLMEDIQGAVLGYTQSDEISLLLWPWNRYGSQAWFAGNLQKVVSNAAAIVSVSYSVDNHNRQYSYFDARAFVLPKEEVVNYFIWRQKDWVRNSVNMLAMSCFSHKELEGKGTEERKRMLIEKGRPWDELSDSTRLGETLISTLDGSLDRRLMEFGEEREVVERLMPEPTP